MLCKKWLSHDPNNISYRDISNEETWDAIATSFDDTRKQPWKQCLKFISELSHQNSVIDIGCGNGRHLIVCAEHCRLVIGVDISQKLLDIVQDKIQKNAFNNVELIHSDIKFLPFKNCSIDAALFIASLHNIKGRNNRINALKEVTRILISEGRAIISVWSRMQDRFRKDFIKKKVSYGAHIEFGDIYVPWKHHGLNVPRFYHLYGKKEFVNDLEIAGLTILNLEEATIRSKNHPDNFFALVQKKK